MKSLKVVSALALTALLLAACDGSGGQGGSLEGLRPAGQTVGAPATSAPAPVATALPVIGKEVQTVVVESTVVVDRPVEVPVEVTREVVVVVTATPEIAGFAPVQPGIDESVQPCPAKYWKGGRCVATQAQIDAWASETK